MWPRGIEGGDGVRGDGVRGGGVVRREYEVRGGDGERGEEQRCEERVWGEGRRWRDGKRSKDVVRREGRRVRREYGVRGATC